MRRTSNNCDAPGPADANPAKQVGLIRASANTVSAVEDLADRHVATEQFVARGLDVGND
jgi:hypothetical protein